MRAPEVQNVGPDLVCSFVICIIEVSSTTQLYCNPTYPLQGIDGVNWLIEYVIFLHIQCEALAIYRHVLFAHVPNTTSCSSSSTYHFRKSASQTSDHLLSAHLYVCSQKFIISLIRSWEEVYEIISQVLFFFRCFPVFRELCSLRKQHQLAELS